MTTEALEDRLTALENELAQIKRQLAVKKPETSPAGWERIFGSFAESEGFDEAVRLGREYRESPNVLSNETDN